MIGKFAHLADLAQQLAAAAPGDLVSSHHVGPIVVALVPAGVQPGIAIANRLNAPLRWVAISETVGVAAANRELSVDLDDLPMNLGGQVVLLVAAAVETGQAAKLAAVGLRTRGAGSLLLLAGVVPREAEASLRPAFDQVIALVRPLGRRAAAWHFDVYAPDSLPAAKVAIAEHRAANEPRA